MNNPRKKAFTLVELLVVIAILAILATTSVVGYTAFITKANISADEQELAQLNGYLNLAGKVESHNQLLDVIDEAFGNNKSQNLLPRSAQHGYNYWYDVQNNTIVLKTFAEIQAQNNTRMRKNALGGGTTSTYPQVAPSAQNAQFAQIEQSNFRMFGNYFLLDSGNSIVGNALDAFNNCENVVAHVENLQNIKNTASNKQLAQEVLNKISAFVFVADSITYVHNADLATTFVFQQGIATVSSNVVFGTQANHVAKAQNVEAILLPQTVALVQENALVFDQAGVVLIHTALEDMQAITGVFQANATNGIVVDSTANQYTISGGTITNKNDSSISGSLAYANPVASFDIATPEDTNDYKTVVDTLYVAYNYNGTIQLGANNFQSTTGNAVSSEQVTWKSDSDHVVVDQNGKLSIAGIPELANCTAKITATAVAGGTEQTLTVYVVRPTTQAIGFYGQEYTVAGNSDSSNVVVTYTNDSGVDFPLTVGTLQDNFKGESPIQINADVQVIAGEGEIFKIENNVLTLLNPTTFVGQTQSFTVSVAGGLLSKTFVVSVDDQSATPFQKNGEIAERENSFLFRVGNGNTIPLGYFFTNNNPANTTLEFRDYAGTGVTATLNDVAGTSWSIDKTNWATLPIQFQGTGVAQIIIGDDKLGKITLMVEVVDGLNVTAYGELKGASSYVLLNDIEMSDNSRFALQNGTLYGNDFTFDVTKGNYTTVRYDDYSSDSDNYRVFIDNGVLDNVRIVGNPFDGFSATKEDPLNICNVLSKGDSKIINCYISYCAAPVRILEGSLEISGTTLQGGSIANLDIRNGNVILENVTTINQKSVNGTPDSEGSVGFGILIWYENVVDAQVAIKGELAQYNYMSKTDFGNIDLTITIPVINQKIDVAEELVKAIFNSNSGTSKFIYTEVEEQWINTGIFSMTDAFGTDQIKHAAQTNQSIYEGATVSYSYLTEKRTGYVYSITTENVVLKNHTGDYRSLGQGFINPNFEIDFTQNEVSKVEGNNDYCYIDKDTIYISFDEGEEKTLNLKNMVYAVKGVSYLDLVGIYLNGVSVVDSITFDKTEISELEFVFDDNTNYDKNGNQVLRQHNKIITVRVVEVEPEAKHAEFTFGSNNLPSEIINVNNKSYVSIKSESANGSVGSIVVDGQTIYYPVVEAYTSDGKNNHKIIFTWYSDWTMCFPVFSGAVTIKDYVDGGKGDAIQYDSTTKENPQNLIVLGRLDEGDGDGDFNGGAAKAFKYQASSDAPSASKVVSNKLCYVSPTLNSNKRDEYNYVVGYQYTDNAGSAYYYFIGYHCVPQNQ